MIAQSAVFKAPQHPQLRVGRRPYKKFWKKIKWILNCLIMSQSQTRPKCTIPSQNFFNVTCVAYHKFCVSPRGRKKILQRGRKRRKVTKHGTDCPVVGKCILHVDNVYGLERHDL